MQSVSNVVNFTEEDIDVMHNQELGHFAAPNSSGTAEQEKEKNQAKARENEKEKAQQLDAHDPVVDAIDPLMLGLMLLREVQTATIQQNQV